MSRIFRLPFLCPQSLPFRYAPASRWTPCAPGVAVSPRRAWPGWSIVPVHGGSLPAARRTGIGARNAWRDCPQPEGKFLLPGRSPARPCELNVLICRLSGGRVVGDQTRAHGSALGAVAIATVPRPGAHTLFAACGDDGVRTWDTAIAAELDAGMCRCRTTHAITAFHSDAGHTARDQR